jgi:hypothetical protein
MTIWILNEAGCIPGVPSDAHPSAGVRVEVDDATNQVLGITHLDGQTEFVAPLIEDKKAASSDAVAQGLDAAPEAQS